jgi:hypothetical protein
VDIIAPKPGDNAGITARRGAGKGEDEVAA